VSSSPPLTAELAVLVFECEIHITIHFQLIYNGVEGVNKMDIKTIIENLNSGNYLIEHTVVEEGNNIVIVGHLQDKKDSSGFGRHEFVIRNKTEQSQFLDAYTEKLKKILG